MTNFFRVSLIFAGEVRAYLSGHLFKGGYINGSVKRSSLFHVKINDKEKSVLALANAKNFLNLLFYLKLFQTFLYLLISKDTADNEPIF